MAELGDVIRGAMADAGIGGEGDPNDSVVDNSTPEVSNPAPEVDNPTPPAEGATPPAEEKKEEPKELTEEEELAKLERELEEKTPTMRNGRIKVSRHQAVVTRNRNRLEAQIAEREAKLKQYERYHEIVPFEHLDTQFESTKERLAAITLAETRPDVFLNQVLKHDPRYTPLFDAMIDAAIKERGLTKAEARAEVVADLNAPKEKPQPDVLNPDGSMGYSAERAEQLTAYYLAQERSAHKTELDKLREELGPVLTVAETEKQIAQSKENMRPVLERARATWRGFKEHESAIRSHLENNPLSDLYEAYSIVVSDGYEKRIAEAEKKAAEASVAREKLKAELHAELVKEMNSRSPRNLARPGAPAAAAEVHDGPREHGDVTRQALREAGLL